LEPRFRSISEVYEPEVWDSLMNEIRPGDTFTDVGVFIGLYTLAVAKRIGPAGCVVAFEPDPINYAIAKEHIKLNALEGRVDLIQAAVGAYNEYASFKPSNEMGHIATDVDEGTCLVECVTLDRIFTDRHLNVLKIDVEGYEEKVLQGAKGLLSDRKRSPRAIFVEVHPYAWPVIGTTSESLLGLLTHYGYEVRTIEGWRVEKIDRYGEIVARKRTG
jgi:FkbM family methyltransferase